MKKILSIMLILVLALSLVACGKKEEGGGDDGGKKKLKFAIIYTALGDFWDMCGQGGYRRVEELKTEYPDYEIELECTAASERGLTAQIQVVENIIALGRPQGRRRIPLIDEHKVMTKTKYLLGFL